MAYPVWWKNEFYAPQNVTGLKIFNYDNGGEVSLLPGASVYIDNTLCAQVPTDIELNQYIFIDCVDYEGNKITEGINGEFIKIEVMTREYGILPVTGLKVFVYEVDQAKEIAIDFGLASCSSSHEQACLEAFSSPDQGNNKWNCLQRYGVENRTA